MFGVSGAVVQGGEARKRWVGSARQLIGIRCVLGVD